MEPEARADELEPEAEPALRWRVNLVMFLLTALSCFVSGAVYAGASGTPSDTWYGFFEIHARALIQPSALAAGYELALPLLTILVCHELGHYVAARLHRVPASLPFFLPLPVLSPFGTAGAVIGMQGRIRSRNALLDIGAAGPIAGLFVTIPLLVWGIANSPVKPLEGVYQQEGQSLLYWALKYAVHGPVPEGYDIALHPTAFAGWGGLLITMLNLLPFGQLDGGHIAYALFGKAQDRVSLWVRRALLVVFAYNLLSFGLPVLLGSSKMPFEFVLGNSLVWLFLYGMLGLLGRVSGGEHPPFEPGPLSPARRVLAWACLVILVLLFMPTPLATYF